MQFQCGLQKLSMSLTKEINSTEVLHSEDLLRALVK